MSEVKISIITPVYNNELHLKRSLDSFLNQTLKEIEFIIVNDGSTDNSESICKEYTHDKRFRYYFKKNEGISSTLNYGYKLAKGKYILMLDADDYISHDLCKATYELAEKLDLDIVNYSHAYIKNKKIDERPSIFPKNKVLYNSDIKSLLKENTYNSKLLWFTWSNLLRKKFIEDNNILHHECLKIGVDSTFNLECYLSAKKIYSINTVFYYYVYNPLSATQKYFKTGLLSEIEAQFNLKLKLYKKYNLTDKYYTIDFSRYYIQHSLFFILSNELNFKEGFKINRIKKIRNSKIFKYCFKHYKSSKDCSLRKKIIIWCFKNRIYFPINKLMKW